MLTDDPKDRYAQEFLAAAEKSVSWKIVQYREELELDPSEASVALIPEAIAELHAFMDGIQNRGIYDLKFIRLNCAPIHLMLRDHLLRRGFHTLLTIGDVLISGKPEYRTSYQYLKRERRGSNSEYGVYNYHVWLTLPDFSVFDATFLLYKLAEHHGGPGIPANFRWADYTYSSTQPKHLDLYHRPMLIGDKLLAEIY